jgi:patatin-like phospholipase/acyl hydrolase
MSEFTRILSIDGGGIRGIIPAQILTVLERKLQERSGHDTARLADYFDLIAGTSIGGIQTCAYLTPDPENSDRPRYTAEEVLNLFFERGGEIFDRSLFDRFTSADGLIDEKYPADGLEEALQDYFGDLTLDQLLRPCLVTAFDVRRYSVHFFNQYRAKQQKSDNFYVRDVARATSAAPTYFESAKIDSLTGVGYPLIDGGVFANNPTMGAYSESREVFTRPNEDKNVTAKDMVILSLGTGTNEAHYQHSNVKDWGLAEWASPMLSIMMSGASESVDYQLEAIFDAIERPQQYVRINPELTVNVDGSMDNATDKNMEALRNLGQKTAENQVNKLEKIVDLLLG